MPCYDCSRPYADGGFPDLIIPNEQWRKISPTGDDGGLLCPSCICKRLHDAGVRNCPGAFMSGPIRSVDQNLMQTLRWLENTREELIRKGVLDDPTQPPAPGREKES